VRNQFGYGFGCKHDHNSWQSGLRLTPLERSILSLEFDVAIWQYSATGNVAGIKAMSTSASAIWDYRAGAACWA